MAEHPALRPLYQLLEPLLRIERQLQVLQTSLESWTEMHDPLEDANLTEIADDLGRMIRNLQEFMNHLKNEKDHLAIRILFTIIINPDVWSRHFLTT